jgi:hypothetical protein
VGPGSARALLTDFITNLSGSSYWNILSSYSVQPLTSIGLELSDQYSAGKSVPDYHQVIVDHITAGDLPEDANGVYLFLPYVGGAHNHPALPDGQDIKIAYAIYPNSDGGRCAAYCIPKNRVAISDNVGVRQRIRISRVGRMPMERGTNAPGASALPTKPLREATPTFRWADVTICYSSFG